MGIFSDTTEEDRRKKKIERRNVRSSSHRKVFRGIQSVYSDGIPRNIPTDFSLTSDEITNHFLTFLAHGLRRLSHENSSESIRRYRKFTLVALARAARASECTLFRVCIYIRMYIFAELKHVVHAGVLLTFPCLLRTEIAVHITSHRQNKATHLIL